MEQYNMKANFYPAAEPKNGYIGFADLTIAEAIRIRGIAVFEKDGGGYNIHFPGYGEKDTSFVSPSSKEAYAQMLSVVESAVKDPEHHFGWQTGKYNPELSVKGWAVNEPYADSRYHLQVGDLCQLHQLSARVVDYKDDGKDKSFVSVDLPTLPPYPDKDGNQVYPPVFEGLKSPYEKDGVKKEKDFGLLIRNLVLAERKKVLEHPPLEEQIDNAAQRSTNNAPAHGAPEKSAVR